MFQKRGVFTGLNQYMIAKEKPDFLVMRTQNPVIYAATRKIVNKLYPSLTKPSEKITDLACFIAKDYLKMEDFDEGLFVGRKTYGCCLYGEVQRHPTANLLFDNFLQLNYHQGDSVILVGVVK